MNSKLNFHGMHSMEATLNNLRRKKTINYLEKDLLL